MPRFRFLLRFLALTGLLAAAGGAVVAGGVLESWHLDYLRGTTQGQHGKIAQVALEVVLGGIGLAVVLFALDMLLGMRASASRRSALGLNVVIQVLLAVALLVGVNVWSFLHYARWDCTRDKALTINPDAAAELRNLRGETTVIVYEQHKNSGRFSDKPDLYDIAAERKIVEKVQDLVDQLREFGPQFRVVVLDVEDRDFGRKLTEETDRFPGLGEAIKSAPENSIFFCAGDHIQRLGFNEFYQLDKTASLKANGGRGNLVLLNQGIDPFVRRVLAIEEKKPRVALLVAHPWLSTEGQVDEYTLAGLRKSLVNYGFDVRDILTNKLVGRRGRGFRLEKSALSIEESRSDRVEAQLTAVRLQTLQGRAELEQGRSMLDLLRSRLSDEDLDRRLSEMYGRRVTMPPEVRQKNVENLSQRIPEVERELALKADKEKALEKELEGLQAQEKVVEGQRYTDLKRKLANLLSDCDVLIIPRMTLIDTSIGDVVPNNLHQLDENQLAAVKDFIKSGKPVLFCLGPTNEPPEPDATPDRKPAAPADNLEALMTEVGFVFAPQAVLFDAEAEAYATNQVLAFGRGGGSEEIPPLEFPEGEVAAGPLGERSSAKPNPLALSLQLVQRSAGQPVNLRLRYPRPLYFRPLREKPGTAVSFLETARASWNEEQPYPTDERPVPRYDAPKPDDPTRGTRLERRRGPFPVGVAVETTLPVSWYDEQYGAMKGAQLVADSQTILGGLPTGFAAESLLPAESLVTEAARKEPGYVTPKQVRLAAIGHGGWFAGPNLGAAQEALMTQTLNWLLRRDDRLPHAEQVWEYPRVELSDRSRAWWRWGAFLGLPGLFAYLGLVVLMVRRMR